MTDNEKMIWAAAYAAHYEKFSRPRDAAICASYAVLDLRVLAKSETSLAASHDVRPEVEALLKEMIS